MSAVYSNFQHQRHLCVHTLAPQRCRQNEHFISHRSFWMAWMRSTRSMVFVSSTVTCQKAAEARSDEMVHQLTSTGTKHRRSTRMSRCTQRDQD